MLRPRPGGIRPLPRASRIIVFDAAAGTVANLTPRFLAVARPDLSADGQRLLFIGRQASTEITAAWELSLGDGSLRKVVDCPQECDRAIYLSSLYTLDATRPTEQIALRCSDSRGGPAELFRCELAGGELMQITYAPPGVSDPLLLSDGRILFAMSVGAGRDSDKFEDPQSSYNAGLFTINPDGTDLFPFFVQDHPFARRHSPIETPGGAVEFVEEPAGSSRVELVSVRRADPLGASTRSELKLTGLRGLAVIDQRYSLATGRLPGTQNESDGVFRMDLHSAAANLVFDEPAYDDYPIALVRARAPAVGRSSVVDRRTNSAQLYALNVNLHDIESAATSLKHAARIRVHSFADDKTSPVVLGELEVERDGSFFGEMPARRPIALESLDSDGNRIRRMESYFWLMPGERRGCIGCHENRALAPPNRHVFALRKLPQRIGPEADALADRDATDGEE